MDNAMMTDLIPAPTTRRRQLQNAPKSNPVSLPGFRPIKDSLAVDRAQLKTPSLKLANLEELGQRGSEYLPTTPRIDSTAIHSKTNRIMQIQVIDKTSQSVTLTSSASRSSSTQKPNMTQILVLKNLKEYHSTEAYSTIQGIVLNDNFYAQLGDKLKDYPQVTHRSPLISLQFFSQELERETKVYNIRDNITIQLTEAKIKRKGYLFGMILYKNVTMQKYILPEHVRMGIDATNEKALFKFKYLIEDPNFILYSNIKDLPWNQSLINSTTSGTRRVIQTEEKESGSFGAGIKRILADAAKSARRLFGGDGEDFGSRRKLQTTTEATNSSTNSSEYNLTSEVFNRTYKPHPNQSHYTLYLVASDRRGNQWTDVTVIKTLDFTLYGTVEISGARLLAVWAPLLALLGGLVFGGIFPENE